MRNSIPGGCFLLAVWALAVVISLAATVGTVALCVWAVVAVLRAMGVI